MPILSLLIPARNEMFLKNTVEDILKNIRGDTEIIVILDGVWASPPLEQNERVIISYHPTPIGQRAACNEAAKLARGKYVMKVDGHCSFDEGFDVKMVEAFKETGDNVTMVPNMRNLHVFDWVCVDGHRRYQGGGGDCKECSKPTTMNIVWRAKRSPNSTSFCFDSTFHFQYFGEYKAKQIGDIVETMGLQGSCFMLTKEKWLELNICDESFGSWGNQGNEVSCKTWLSGGRVLCNKRTWYAHLFRTQEGFRFPYPNPESEVQKTKAKVKDIFFNNKWPNAIHPLHWLLEKFWPVKGWTEDALKTLKNL